MDAERWGAPYLGEQIADPPVSENIVDIYEKPLIHDLSVGHEEQ